MRHQHRRRPLPLHRLARMSQPSRDPPTGLRMVDEPRWVNWLIAAVIFGALIVLSWALGLVRPA